MFNVTGGLYNLPIANSSHSAWERNIERFLDGALPHHNFESDDWFQCFSCPLEPHVGAYDQEFQKSLVEMGIVLTDTFLLDDLAYPSSIWFHSVVTPNSAAPVGPSFDNSNGPILPSSIFPLERGTTTWKANNRVIIQHSPRQYEALDRQSLQYTDDDGAHQDLDYTGLNYSHLHLTMGIHSPSLPSGFVSDEMGQVGNHEATGTVLDRDGNGWEITSRITVVDEPTDVFGDLNYNGELDQGDLNIVTQNVALMPAEGHEFSEEQLRLDMNGDESVDVSDVHHWVIDLKSTWIGDANLDGQVTALDLNALAVNWQTVGGASWEQGDFTGDGNVDAADLNALALNWQSGTAAAPAAVPEPSSVTLLLLGACAFVRHAGRFVR